MMRQILKDAEEIFLRQTGIWHLDGSTSGNLDYKRISPAKAFTKSFFPYPEFLIQQVFCYEKDIG